MEKEVLRSERQGRLEWKPLVEERFGGVCWGSEESRVCWRWKGLHEWSWNVHESIEWRESRALCDMGLADSSIR